jgi:CDGSH-type Zn-finger protein
MENQEIKTKVTCINNGPVVVMGPIEVTLPDGTVEIKPRASFCRCGLSDNKPFCDGTHKASPFE